MIELADKMDISFEPDYIMQDACQASYNAAIKIFNANNLMCYFHVLHNVRKNIKYLNNNVYECLLQTSETFIILQKRKLFKIIVIIFKKYR